MLSTSLATLFVYYFARIMILLLFATWVVWFVMQFVLLPRKVMGKWPYNNEDNIFNPKKED